MFGFFSVWFAFHWFLMGLQYDIYILCLCIIIFALICFHMKSRPSTEWECVLLVLAEILLYIMV